MKKTGQISAFQMFAILFLCRVISLFTFMLPTTLYLQSGDRIITTIPVMLFEIAFASIALYALKRTDNRSIITAAGDINRFLPRIFSVLYAFCFIWFAGIGVARFELFISTVMFPNSELYLMVLLLLASAFYASLKGIESIARTSSILLAILGTSVVFILITVSGDFNYTNLKPLFTDGMTPIISFAFYVSVRTVEIITLLITAPCINGNKTKLTYSWIVVFSFVTLIILSVLGGVTGEYGDDQIFPLYTLTVIARFGIFERLDDILTGIWVLCSFIQLSFLIFSASLSIKQGFPKSKKIPVCFVCSIGIFCFYLLSSSTVTRFSEIASSRVQEIFYLGLTIVIPILIIIFKDFRKRREKT